MLQIHGHSSDSLREEAPTISLILLLIHYLQCKFMRTKLTLLSRYLKTRLLYLQHDYALNIAFCGNHPLLLLYYVPSADLKQILL